MQLTTSTQLQMESQANRNKAAAVQTVLQRMAVERNNFDQTNKLLTDEYCPPHAAMRAVADGGQLSQRKPIEPIAHERSVRRPQRPDGLLCLRADGRPW